MKYLVCLLLSVAFVFYSPPTKTISAEETVSYSRVLTTTTGFYSDSTGRNLKFYLPYGYYVKVLEVGPSYAKVSYQNENSHFPYLTGFVKTLDLIISDKTPITPYPLVSLTVISDDVLFSDSSLQNSKIGVYANTIAIYYGELTSPSQENLVYVYCNGHLGYMRKSCFAPFVIPAHPDPIITDAPTSSEQTKTPTSNKVDNLQILIVAGVSVIVVSFVYFIFRPNSKRVKEDYYQED